jgi:hypothetical protein
MTARSAKASGLPPATLTPIGTLLFSASEPGAWDDPSDLSTLFQDAAGTTPVTAVEQPVGRILDKSGRGNHATQSTTTKRPVYSRRYNTFTSTDDFTASFWTKAGLSVTPAAMAAPNGTLTASKIVESSANVAHYIINSTSRTGPHKLSIVAKAGERAWLRVWGAPSFSNAYTNFNLASGVIGTSSNLLAPPSIVGLGGGWYECSITALGTGSGGSFGYQIVDGDNGLPYLGDGVSGLYIWGASLTLATDAHLPYQWVNTATDYDADPAKFPAYRRLDGVDDSHATATGGGGTAGFFFSASVTPQGGAGTARTLFSDAGTNTGYIVRLNTSNQLELSAGNGTAYTTVATSGTLAVGATDVVQAWDDGTNLNVKIGNGATASVARPTVSAGTAGYTMGQDNGASTGYFNGRIYSTIYRKDSGLTQVQREAVALYQRQKARMP